LNIKKNLIGIDTMNSISERNRTYNEFIAQFSELKQLNRNNFPDSHFASIDQIQPVEAGLHKYFNDSFRSNGTDRYNRLQFEGLLKSGIDLLGRSQSLRDDAMELTIRHINENLERLRTAEELRLSLQELEDENSSTNLDLRADKKQIKRFEERNQYLSSLAAQSDEVKKDLFENNSKIEYLRDNIRVKMESIKSQIEHVKFNIEWNKKLISRTSLSGSALDYDQRRETLQRAFRANILEGYWRTKAAYEGILFLFPNLAPIAAEGTPVHRLLNFPEIGVSGEHEVGYVDALLDWARHCSFVLHRRRQFELEYVRSFSLLFLVNQYAKRSGSSALSKAQFADLLKGYDRVDDGRTPQFDFEFIPENFPGLKDVRLLDVKLKIHRSPRDVPAGNDRKERGGQTLNAHAEVPCVLTLPPQKSNDDQKIGPSLLPIGNARIIEGHPNNENTRINVRNAKPIGPWSLKILFPSLISHDLNGPVLNQIILEMKVAATPVS
jgi:hypothetical protein